MVCFDLPNQDKEQALDVAVSITTDLPAAIPPLEGVTLFNQIASVAPNIYLSAATALDPLTLERLGLSLLINVTTHLPLLPLEGVETVRVAVKDDAKSGNNLLPHFEGLTSRIRQEVNIGGVVLIHCAAGVSRSPTICLAYMIRYHGFTLKQAWKHLSTVRPWIRPNRAFMDQLHSWELRLREKRMG